MNRFFDDRLSGIELLVLVTPEIIDALDPHEVPRCGPGEFTTSPSDVELYWKGYLEVPKCCSDGSCAKCQGARAGAIPALPNGLGVPVEIIPGSEDPSPSDATLPLQHAPAAQSPAAVSPTSSVNRSRFLPMSRPLSSSPYNPTNLQPTAETDLTKSSTFPPEMIGPVGYDVHE